MKKSKSLKTTERENNPEQLTSNHDDTPKLFFKTIDPHYSIEYCIFVGNSGEANNIKVLGRQ